ncbi:MAG: hypothetical protein ACSLE6_04260 [Mycobacterium sp.]
MALTEADVTWLRRCVELARQTLGAGGEPFGSVLVACRLGASPSPVAPLPINTVAPSRPNVVVDGPAPELEEEMKALYAMRFRP